MTWARVPDPDGSPTLTRSQVAGAKRFNGGEGCYYADGICWFTTKGDNRVWAYDAVNQRIDLAYDDSLVSGTPPLTGVDNITGSRGGDLFVAEDGGNMEINIITPDEVVAPFLRITGQGSSEITGPAFSPDGTRLYFSSQRGTSGCLVRRHHLRGTRPVPALTHRHRHPESAPIVGMGADRRVPRVASRRCAPSSGCRPRGRPRR